MAQHTSINHYIPKVLIRRFSNNRGERFYCENGNISKKDAKKIFSLNGIYDDALEKFFNINESKLNNIFDGIEEELKIKTCVLMREIVVPEWNITVYNSKDNKEAVDILNAFFLRMNLKFYAANTNKNPNEIDLVRDALTKGSFDGCKNIAFIKYNFNFCPFVLPANIPVILPVGMSLVFVTPISTTTLMLHYTNKELLEKFIEKYSKKHHINQAMIVANTPNGRMLCNFVCSDKEYAARLVNPQPPIPLSSSIKL